MKKIRNAVFGMVLDYNVSLQLNPVITILCTAVTTFCLLNVLVIFGVL